MSSLQQKYPGGLRRFAKKHTIRSNRDLVAVATMGDDDLYPIIEELYDAGLRPGKDFTDFDATMMAMFCNRFQKVGLGVDWLAGQVLDDMAIAVRMKGRS